MPGGSYNVVQAESCPSNKKDTSFRSCICALLVVLCICLIGLLASAFLRGSRKEKKEDDNDIFGSGNQNQDLTTKFITKLTKEPTVSISTKATTESKSTASIKTTDYTKEKVSEFNTKTTTSNLNGIENTSTNVYEDGTTINMKNTDNPVTTDKSMMITETTPISAAHSSTIKEEFARETTTFYINGKSTVTIPQSVQNITSVTKNFENYSEEKTETGTQETTKTTETLFSTQNKKTIANLQQTGGTTTQTPYTFKTTGTVLKEIQTTTDSNFPLNFRNAFSNSNQVCETASCRSAAVDILTPMNHSVDPCDDFYEFACGRFTKKKSEKNEFLLYVNRMPNTSSDYLKAVKIFFDSCISHESKFLSSETIQQARRLVDNVGELSIDNATGVSVQDLSELLAKLILRQSVPFFDVDLGVNTANGSSSYILQLTLPQHSVSEWSSLSENRRRCLRLQSGKTYGENLNLTEIYESFLECQKNYSVYLDSMENVVRTLGMLENVKNDSQLLGIIKEIRFTVEDIFKILEILPSPYEVQRSLINQDKVTMTASDLTQKFPQLDWSIFIKTIMPIQPTSDAIIDVFMFDYFTKAFQELYALGYKKVFNALLAIYAQDVYSNVVFEPVTSDREDFCVGRASDLFPDVVNYMYKTNEMNFDVERNITEIIFNKLKTQLASSLDSASNWMENNVIVKFKSKINQATLRFNEISDFSTPELESRYQNFSMEEDAYVRNVERAVVKRRQNLYSFWGENLRKEHIFQIFAKSDSDQPLFFDNDNTFYIPDGMLKSVHENRPFYLSMSTVGWRLAKVLATAFDPINVKSILLKSSTYNSLVESTREQLKHVNEINFNGHSVTLNWNGSLSVNKRIVDNTAFRLLLDASQPDDSFNEVPLPLISLYYSREKIIFISAVQEFCEEMSLLSYMERIYESENLPAPLMAENVLINSQNFATTFECKPGSSMNIFDVRYQFPYLEKVEDYNNYEYETNN